MKVILTLIVNFSNHSYDKLCRLYIALWCIYGIMHIEYAKSSHEEDILCS